MPVTTGSSAIDPSIRAFCWLAIDARQQNNPVAIKGHTRTDSHRETPQKTQHKSAITIYL